MADVSALLDRCNRLASVPGVLVRVVAMLSAGDYEPVELEKVIRADEGIMAAVIGAANSAAFGASGKAFSLEQSIVRLGSRNLTQIALAQQAGTMLEGGGAAYGLRRVDLWKSAVGGAIAAETFARELRVCDPGMAYAAALLRDIGKLAIDTALSADALQGIDESLVECEGFEIAEHALLGVNHAELGGALADRWGLPERIANAIRLHHAPPPPGEPDADPMIDVVHAADLVSMWAGLAIGDDGLGHRMAPHISQTLGLTRPRLEQAVAEVWAAVEELQAANDAQSTRELSS